jgi:hypothetical protein
MVSFLLACSHFIIASATCIWYFGPSRALYKNPIQTSIFWLIRYHLGSIAFGSILLAIVWALRILAQYIVVCLCD